jgi:hypothetical protein
MRRTLAIALTVMALLGLCIQANAQTLCPELARLRDEAQGALKQSRIAPPFERCYRNNRLSEAWDAVAQYARDNRASCHVAITMLDDFERYRSEAIKDRDNVCAGRLRRPFPADIIQH